MTTPPNGHSHQATSSDWEYWDVACPVCAESIGQIPVMGIAGVLFVMPTQATDVVLFVNGAMAHMVKHHTTGLTDEALSLLLTWLTGHGAEDDFDKWKQVFGVASP
jgi:hypothetical protein